MCFRFGAWRKGADQKGVALPAAAPQTLLGSGSAGGLKSKSVRFNSKDSVRSEFQVDSKVPESEFKGVRFDSEPEKTISDKSDQSISRRPGRKGTPWQGGGQDLQDALRDATQAVQFTDDVEETDEKMEMAQRRQVRKGTPWVTDSPEEQRPQFASVSHMDEDGNSVLEKVCEDDEMQRRPDRKGTPWTSNATMESEDGTSRCIRWSISGVEENGAEEDAGVRERKAVRKGTPWHGNMEVVADDEKKPGRRIRWSVSAEEAWKKSNGDDVVETESLSSAQRRPGRKATPFHGGAQAVASSSDNERQVCWSKSTDLGDDAEATGLMRQAGRKATPFHSGAQAVESSSDNDRHVQWSKSTDLADDAEATGLTRLPGRKGTPWHAGVQSTEAENEDEKRIQFSKSVSTLDGNGDKSEDCLEQMTSIERRSIRKGTPWAGDLKIVDMEPDDEPSRQAEEPLREPEEEAEVASETEDRQLPRPDLADNAQIECGDDSEETRAKASSGSFLFACCWNAQKVSTASEVQVHSS